MRSANLPDLSCFEPSSQPERTFRSLLRALGVLRQVMHPLFQQHNLTPAQWAVLRLLSQTETAGGPPLTVTDLGKLLLVRPPSVTGVVDGLVERGLVSRRSCQADARVREMVLTAKGRRLHGALAYEHEKRVRQIMQPLSSDELQRLQSLLDKLAGILESPIAPAKPAGNRAGVEE